MQDGDVMWQLINYDYMYNVHTYIWSIDTHIIQQRIVVIFFYTFFMKKLNKKNIQRNPFWKDPEKYKITYETSAFHSVSRGEM